MNARRLESRAWYESLRPRELDGHDHRALLEAFGALPFEPGRPSCLLAHTHKGQGVSFIRDNPGWHHRVPTAAELAAALQELGEGQG